MQTDSSHAAVLALLDSMIERHKGNPDLTNELADIRSHLLEATQAGNNRILHARLLAVAAWARSLFEALDGPP